MPVSTDNQDYKNPENKEGQNSESGKNTGNSSPEAKNNLTSDDLKGKKVDADVEQEEGKPADL